MSIHDVCLQLIMSKGKRAIRRTEWARDNSYLLLREDGRFSFIFYGNCIVGPHCLSLEDMISRDWEVCEAYV